ncbi:MAG: VCBS repeat-containing protein [Deltaproteobacteria bacterium]|nr:VCBS repeat-containing protein [Deltaproteobacteria bacterium]
MSNTGNATMHVTAVSVTGDPEISLTTPGSFQIASGGGDETVTVQCSAVNGGSYAATLSVTHDAVGSPASYPVTCDVAEPGFASSPAPGATLSLATLAGTPTSTDVVVSETSDATLSVSNVAVTGDPELALSTASSFQIADGGASVTVTVECSAVLVGTYTGTLTITHDADGSPASYAVSCEVAPVPVQGYSSSPAPGATLNLGTVAGTPTTTDVVVSETGNTTLVVTSVAVSGDAALSLVTPSSFQIADGGASETLTVQCSSAQVGTYTGSLTVTHGGDGSPAIYPISCSVTAVPMPGFASDPAPESTIPITTVAGTPLSSNIVVSETGNLPLVVSDVSLTGDPEISLLTPTSFTIADGDPSQAVSVQCDAANAGDYSATLTISHNAFAPGSPLIRTHVEQATYTIDCTVSAAAAPGYASVPSVGATIPMITGRGIPADERITVSDSGNAILEVSDIEVTGDAAITLTSATSFVLDYRAPSHDITFRCASATSGSFAAVITVHHNAGASAQYAVSCNVGGIAGDTRGDFDGDGHPDLVWEDQRDGSLSVWLMNGAQRLAQRPLDPSHTPGASWHVVGSGDFNGDAKADLLLQNSSTGAMKVWFMNAMHKFGEADVTPSSIADPKQVVVAVADMNGDGRPDVVRQVPGKMPMNVVFLKGASVLGQTSINPDKASKTSAKVLGAPDLDDDGKPDFLFTNKGQLMVMFMDGVTRTGTASLDPSAAPTTKDMLVGNADFNGDGKTDLLFENRKSGALVLWTMNGIHRLNAVPTAPAKEVDPHLVIAAPR